MSHDRIDPPWVIGANVGDDTSHWVKDIVGSMFLASGGGYDSETGLLRSGSRDAEPPRPPYL